MNIASLVNSVKAANLDKFQLTEIVYKRLLRGFDFPVDDSEKVVANYIYNSSDVASEFAYIVDDHPVIAVFVEDSVEGNSLDGEIEVIARNIDVMFLLTLSGVSGTLYYRGDGRGAFYPVRTKSFTESTIRRAHEFSPEYILSRDIDYWEDIVNKELYKRVEKSKFKCKLNIIDTLNELYPNQISQRNIDDILKIIIGDKKVEENEYGSYSKLLSEIDYDIDLRHTTIKSALIGEEEYPSITYHKLMIELVRYMEKFVNSDNIHKIKKAGLHKGTCQMKDRLSELSPSYRDSHIVLGNTYIGMSSTGSRIINTTKRLFDSLGIDQDTVLLEWVDDNPEVVVTRKEPKPNSKNKNGNGIALSEISDVNEFTFTRLEKATIFEKEVVNPSYREVTRQVVGMVNDNTHKDSVDRVLSRQKNMGQFFASNYHSLNHANKRNNCQLGSHYVGLNYDTKETLTLLILICELFDVDQDEIILYLK